MKKNGVIILFIMCFLGACDLIKDNQKKQEIHKEKAINEIDYSIKLDTLTLIDTLRKRKIPIAIYQPESQEAIEKQELVIVNHGYFFNESDSYLKYSFITKKLASKGYFVVSVQHEIKTDALIPKEGNPQIVRRPFWEKGVNTINYVIATLKNTHKHLNFDKTTLIGHSNGGDIIALFAEMHPNSSYKIITLDNRRMALPRKENLKVFSLRSSDQIADEGVLPTIEEQKKFPMTIVKLPNTIHNDMNDVATDNQKKEMLNYILSFLKK